MEGMSERLRGRDLWRNSALWNAECLRDMSGEQKNKCKEIDSELAHAFKNTINFNNNISETESVALLLS